MKYGTDDGKEFDNEAAAKKHEASLKKEINFDLLDKASAADFKNAIATGKGAIADEIVKMFRALDKVREKRKVTRKPKLSVAA